MKSLRGIRSFRVRRGTRALPAGHAAAYALVSYQTAYLKTHYPVEFMAGLMTSEMGDTDKVIKNLAECRKKEIEVLAPDSHSAADPHRWQRSGLDPVANRLLFSFNTLATSATVMNLSADVAVIATPAQVRGPGAPAGRR